MSLVLVEDKQINFGMNSYPDSEFSCQNTLFLGSPGSGKTLTMDMLMQSALSHKQPHRALVFDEKREVMPKLEAAGCVAKLFNPDDLESHYWDIQKDTQGIDDIEAFTYILFPDEKGNDNKFWQKTTRAMFKGAWLALHQSGKRYRFHDLIRVCLSKEGLVASLLRTPEGKLSLDNMMGDDTRSKGDIAVTLQLNVERYASIASVWSYIPEHKGYSCKDWYRPVSNDWLVLSYSKKNEDVTKRILQCIFHRATQLVLDGREISGRGQGTWFFLDELPRIGFLKNLESLLNTGRSKGARIVLGVQDLALLEDIYGKYLTEAIISQCSNIACYRVQNPRMAEWVSSRFSEYEVTELSTSVSDTFNDDERYNYSLNRRNEKIVLPIEIMNLPKPGGRSRTPLTGYCITPCDSQMMFKNTVRWETIAPALEARERRINSNRLRKKHQAFIPRPSGHYHLDISEEAIQRTLDKFNVKEIQEYDEFYKMFCSL